MIQYFIDGDIVFILILLIDDNNGVDNGYWPRFVDCSCPAAGWWSQSSSSDRPDHVNDVNKNSVWHIGHIKQDTPTQTSPTSVPGFSLSSFDPKILDYLCMKHCLTAHDVFS